MSANDENPVHPMFRDAVIKAHWAQQNINDLGAFVRRYNEEGIAVARTEPDHGRPYMEWIWRSEPITPPLTLRVGDIIRNLRAPLDYCVSAIYEAHGKNANHAYFPIGDDKNALEGTIKGGLVKAGFEELADFFLNSVDATEAGCGSAIWQLNKLDRIAKHRNLIVTSEIVMASLPNSIGRGGVHRFNVVAFAPGRDYAHRVPVGDGYNDSNAKPSLQVSLEEGRFAPHGDLLPVLVSFNEVVLQTLQKTQEAYIAAYGV